MKRYLLSLALISLCLLSSAILGQAAGAAGKAEDVLDQMEGVGRQLNSLVASLWQQKTNTQLGLKDSPESGMIYYMPGKSGEMKLRVDISKPARTIVISGDLVKFYEAEARQMIVTSLKSASKNQSSAT